MTSSNSIDPIIGIDLGTTNTCVAVIEGEQPVVVPTREGHNTMPSMVAKTKDGQALVGHLAKRQALTNPGRTVYGAKRLIGRRFEAPEVQSALEKLTFDCVVGPHDDIRIQLDEEECLAVPEISARILAAAKEAAEAHIGEPVERAVVTVPAYFNDNQRQATRDAGRIAGLEVVRMINEPTAAALAYGFGKSVEQKVAVYDLGGGTFDVSVLELSEGVFEVLATAGDSFLGGEDFDERIIDWLLEGFQREHGIDLSQDRMALQRLRDAAERAKIELSSTAATEIQLPFVHTSAKAGTLHIQQKFTREVFQGLVADLIQRTLDITRSALKSAGVTPKDLGAVLLVGGMTRMVRVHDAVERFFGVTPSRGVHADEAVAVGAAIQASLLAGQSRQTLLLDVTSQDLGIGVAGGLFDVVIPRDTAIPTSTTKEFTTAQDDQTLVRIVVMQGTSQRADENELLGEFLLEGLRRANRGELRIEVKFEISVDGMVSVSARDLETGHAQNLTVTASSGLTDEEIVQMSADREKNLLASVSTDAVDSIVGVAEGLLQRASGRYEQIVAGGAEAIVGKEALDKSKSALDRCRDALESGDEERIQDAIKALERIDDFLLKVSERLEGQ